jgi:serine/threonine protein kinase
MNERERKEIQVFSEALEFTSATERADYLSRACGKDEVLRQKVQALLQIQAEADGFFGTVTSDVNRAVLSAAARSSGSADTNRSSDAMEAPGTMIGRYKLLQKIGEGGCGVVYMAEQEEPVRRRVALKIIKLGMDTKSVIARFEAERQALAMMDHPNIAKVHDAGATETGRPYFVMELVRGVRITDYCDEKNLSTQERLDLFVQVCHTVQHAHQKGIIHRDLKPSNILVNIVDGQPVPKVIDFGIAKATNDQRLTDKTVFTAFEQFIGTPAYMSPEQAEVSGVDVDTRSDIYSLGVLLYELLTGKTPFDAKKLLQAGLEEMRRTIREEEPERPSTKVGTLGGEELTSTAQRRGLEAPKLVHSLRGDLDWIVMKCLEKDRSRRYETANGLARDVQRHLENEPVVARPPSAAYRLQKMVRRNKILFAASGLVTAALVLGLGISTWMFFRERAGRREQARLRQQAKTEAAKSGQVAQFLKSVLQGVGPNVALGRDVTVLREILDQTAKRIDSEFANQPEVEADLRDTIGQTYHDIGQYTDAEAMHRRALALRKRVLGTGDVSLAISLTGLGYALLGEGKQQEARVAWLDALELRRKLLPKDHPDLATSMCVWAMQLFNDGHLAESETMHREALAIRRRILGEKHVDVAFSLNNLANTLTAEKKYQEAESQYRQALTLRQELIGPKSTAVAATLGNVGSVLWKQGRLDEAESLLRQSVAIYREVLDDRHSYTIGPLHSLASLLSVEGKESEAKDVYREIVTRSRNLVDQSSANELDIAAWLMATSKHADLRDGPKAISLAEQAVAITHRKQPGYLETLAAAYAETGQFEKAASTQREVIALLTTEPEKRACAQRAELLESKVPVRDDRVVSSEQNELAWLLATSVDPKLRNGAKAVSLAEMAVSTTQRARPDYLDTLAAAYAENGEFAKAADTQIQASALLQDEATKKDFDSRLQLYKSRHPYRETNSTANDSR